MTTEKEWIKDIEEEKKAYSTRSKIGFLLLIMAFLSIFLSDYFIKYVENIYIVIFFIAVLFLALKLLSNPFNDIDLFILSIYSIGKRVEHFGQESDISIKKNKKFLKNCQNEISKSKNFFQQGETYYINNIHNFLNNTNSIILKLNNLNQHNSANKFNIDAKQLASEIKELAILIHEENSMLDEKPLKKINRILNCLKDVDEKALKIPFPQVVSNYIITNFWKPLPIIVKIILLLLIIGTISFYILSLVTIKILGFEESIAYGYAFYGSMMVIAALIAQAHRISGFLKVNL